MKILFICTSNQDRSPALENYFREVYPEHEYRSAGINKYFCGKKGTHYLTQDDIDWADLIVYAEQIHFDVINKNFMLPPRHCGIVEILSCGNYLKGALHDDYLTCAEQKLEHLLK